MNTLVQQQQSFLNLLFARPQPIDGSLGSGSYPANDRGMMVYRSNAHVLAQRALGAAYPVLEQLLGQDSFANLSRALWHDQPPTLGDIAQWGHALPEFVRNSAQLVEEPYLGDVAQVEWALHCASLAADLTSQHHTFALLTREAPETLHFMLAPGVAAMQSLWPTTDIMLAHREGTPDFAEVGQKIRARVAQECVIWRKGYAPELRHAVQGEYVLLKALIDGATIGDALDAAQGLDFADWLPMAVQTGLVLGVAQALHKPFNL